MAQGRKSIDDEPLTETISLRLTKKELTEFEIMSQYLEIPKTRLMRNILMCGMDEAKALNKIGALTGISKLNEFRKKFFSIK